MSRVTTRWPRLVCTCAIAALLLVLSPDARAACPGDPAVEQNPPAPAPEPIEVTRLALPPTVTSGQAGGFLPDSSAVSLASGSDIWLIKADGTTFSSGDPWKCLTCGMPAANKAGAGSDLSYPQPFRDGYRIKAGTNIVQCDAPLASDACIPQNTHAYPLHWQVTADDLGPGGSIRETRISPDDVHLGWNHLVLGPLSGVDPTNPRKTLNLDEFAYYGRLEFNAARSRYDLKNVYGLYNFGPGGLNSLFIQVDPNDPTRLVYNQAGAIGEFRGFTGDGQSALGMGWGVSNNTDIYATELFTPEGKSHRLTADPAYTDPIDSSPDSKWTVALENRYMNRMWFIAGLPGVPPVNHIMAASSGAATVGYNKGQRRLFQPILLDWYGERGDYHGQQVNACPPGEDENTPGSLCDPNWGTQADPRWSPDGTMIVYGQNLAQAPDCDGQNGSDPINGADCETSTEPGGRKYRLMLARLTSRTPQPVPQIGPLPDEVAWGTAYHPGDSDPFRSHVPAGVYTLDGTISGSATVVVTEDPDKANVLSVSAVYDNYTDDGVNVVNGTETVTNVGGQIGPVNFESDVLLSGCHTGSRLTPPGGYTTGAIAAVVSEMAYAGYMVTTLDGKVYQPPLPTK